MLFEEKLKKISNSVFQEMELTEDGSSPLEWRRDWNFTNFTLKNLQIKNLCTVHEASFSFENENAEQNEHPLKKIVPKVSDNILIVGEVDKEQSRDSIYCAVEEDKKNSIYRIERIQGSIIVKLSIGEPSEESEIYPKGIYAGFAIRANYEPGVDNLYFELHLPKKQILSLVRSIRLNDNPILNVDIYLLSFTSELDDVLREHYFPQDIVIKEHTNCVVSGVNLASKYGVQENKSVSEEEDYFIDAEEEYTAGSEDEHNWTVERANFIRLFSKHMGSLATAVWVLLIVLVIQLVLK